MFSCQHCQTYCMKDLMSFACYRFTVIQNMTQNSFATKSNFIMVRLVNAKKLNISIYLSSLSAHCFWSTGRYTGMLHVIPI